MRLLQNLLRRFCKRRIQNRNEPNEPERRFPFRPRLTPTRRFDIMPPVFRLRGVRTR
jgi:hypothetical protein